MAKVSRFKTYVAGVSYRQDAVTRSYEGQAVLLLPDPDNEHDKNAVEVWAGNEQIGFINRDEAKVMARQMALGTKYDAVIDRVFEGDGGFLCVDLMVTVTPKSLLSSGDGKPRRKLP